jgi:hypothetical protein
VRAFLAVLATALIAAPAAVGHGGGRSDYLSQVTSITPRVDGLTAVVLERDDRLRLTAEHATTVFGYEGEPYLRFTRSGVLRNANSPATYLNEERYGGVKLPAGVDAEAEPRWVRVASGSAYEWHDHRIHWMSTIPPPRVRDNPDERQRVLDWRVPIEVDGRRGAIAGTLDYTPPGSRFRPILIVPLVALLGAGGLWWALRRRSQRT